MSYSTTEIWVIIIALGIGTYLIRFSFIGLVGDRELPPFLLRLLRYTPVAILPGMVAPLVFWPTATGGLIDPARLLAAGATIFLGVWTKNPIFAILGGGSVLALALNTIG